ncbi:elongation factor Ts [bacterium]|jgi:elongation factor Ts|nr:elongation factor Ts [bacterium]
MAVTMENIKELRAATGAGVVDCRNALVACDGDVDKAADWLREKGIAKAAKKASRIAAEGLTEIAVAANTAVVIEVNSETDFVAKNEKFQKLVKALAAAVLAAKPANMEEALKVKMETGTLQEVITDATFTIGEKISFRRFEVVNKKDSESFGAYVHMGGKIAALTVVEGQDQEELARDLAMHVAALSPSYVSMNDIPKDVVEHEEHIQLAAAKNDPKLANKPEQALVKILEGKVRKSLAELCLNEQDFVKEPTFKVGKYVADKGSAVVGFVRYAVGEGLQRREDDFAQEVLSQIK